MLPSKTLSKSFKNQLKRNDMKRSKDCKGVLRALVLEQLLELLHQSQPSLAKPDSTFTQKQKRQRANNSIRSPSFTSFAHMVYAQQFLFLQTVWALAMQLRLPRPMLQRLHTSARLLHLLIHLLRLSTLSRCFFLAFLSWCRPQEEG